MLPRTTLLIVGILVFIVAVCATFIVRCSRPVAIKPASADSATVIYQPPPATPEPVPTFGKPLRDSVSPFAIRKYLVRHQKDESVSLEEFWRSLEIENWKWRGYGKCETGIFKLQPRGKTGSKVMLRLYDPQYGGSTRYLIFKPRKSGRKQSWDFIGYIDCAHQRDQAPRHRVVTVGNHQWLVLTMLDSWGSGFGLYKDVWYEIDRSGVTPVLSYPSKKSSWFFPVLESSSRILDTRLEAGKLRITIRFSVRYSWYDDPGRFYTLWRKRQTASFVRTDSKKFVPDPHKSGISERELDTIYGDTGMIPDEIVRYNYPDLVKIATGREGKPKAWLRLYFESSPLSETPEKIRLTQLLGKNNSAHARVRSESARDRVYSGKAR